MKSTSADGKLVQEGDTLYMVHKCSYGLVLGQGLVRTGKYLEVSKSGGTFTAPVNHAYFDRKHALDASDPYQFGPRVELHGDPYRLYVTIYEGNIAVAKARPTFPNGYLGDIEWTGETEPDLMSAIEKIITTNAIEHTTRSNARIAQGRRDWAALPQEERDALNAYALATEGHTID